MKKIPLLLAALVAAGLLLAACGRKAQGEWVDLGLPSGLLWYSCNLGASKPEARGNYYAWGETARKGRYGWHTYRYYGYRDRPTKYCTDEELGYAGYADTLTILEALDDAAAQTLGGGARTPTKAEWEELKANTTAVWTESNGVKGSLLTGPNGRSLFLPATGGRINGSRFGTGEWGEYWSASLDESDPTSAWLFYISADSLFVCGSLRYCGSSVRPVCSAR